MKSDGDMEGVVCFVDKVEGLFDRYGLTSSSEAVDIPKALLSLLSSKDTPLAKMPVPSVNVEPVKKSFSVAVGLDIPLFDATKLPPNMNVKVSKPREPRKKNRFSEPEPQHGGTGPSGRNAQQVSRASILDKKNNNTSSSPLLPTSSGHLKQVVHQPQASANHTQVVPQLKRSQQHLDSVKPAGWPWNTEEIKLKFAGGMNKRTRH